MSNIDRTGRTGTTAPSGPAQSRPASAPPARITVPAQLPDPTPSTDLPSAAGTAVLNLTVEQIAQIRLLLVAMRLGRSLASDVRTQIFGLLTAGQRRVAGAAYFIFSVRA